MMTHIQEMILRNRQEYAGSYQSMNWLTPETAALASRSRGDVIQSVFSGKTTGPGWQFSGTKLYTHAISPGCTLCGNGDWSCLFINGVCNARCFYCPSAQKDKVQPMTSTVEFSNPHDYADYVNAFNIKGVSFSGGEPLMTFDRVLLFLKTLRAKVSHPLYIWMYTNGILADKEKLSALRDAGLDEIRFDLSANQYSLDSLKKALGVIPCVTVEIPAIPEDLDITRQVIKELADLGVDYLNLHQLRCTQFNKAAFIKRGYTFVHGPGVTILETEATALALIQYALDEKIALPINYCSFAYRNQFQRAGARKRNAIKIKAAHEDITLTGHIRSMSLHGEQEHVTAIHQHLLSKEKNTTLWQLSKKGDHLYFNAQVWPLVDFTHVRLKVAYSGTALKSAVSFRHPFKEVALNRKKKVVVERYTQQPGLWFEKEDIDQFGRYFVSEMSHSPLDQTAVLPPDRFNQIREFESFHPGLAEYF